MSLLLSANPVSRNYIAIKRYTEFRRPNLGLKIHPVDPKALFKSKNPFEIIHQTPKEVTANRPALGGGALQLRQVVAKVHNAIEVVDLAFGAPLIGGRRSVLADIDGFDVPDLRRQPRRPIDRLGSDPEPLGIYVRKRGGEWQDSPARLLVGGGDVELRRVDIKADEIVRRRDDLQLFVGKFGGGGAGIF